MPLLFALLIASSSPTVAASIFDRAKHDQRLDKLIADKDYKAFSTLVSHPQSPDEARANLDWMKVRWLSGTTALVPLIYAQSLWSMTEGQPADDPQVRGLRGTALGAWLYVYRVTSIDGARCGDRSAPGHRLDQLAHVIPNLGAYVRSMTTEERTKAVQIAIGIERKTAAVRDEKGDIEFFCRDGLEETSYNLQHGTSREVPAQPGQMGRQIELKGDGKYVPSTVSETIWRPVAAKARDGMPARLYKIVGLTDAGQGNLAAPAH